MDFLIDSESLGVLSGALVGVGDLETVSETSGSGVLDVEVDGVAVEGTNHDSIRTAFGPDPGDSENTRSGRGLSETFVAIIMLDNALEGSAAGLEDGFTGTMSTDNLKRGSTLGSIVGDIVDHGNIVLVVDSRTNNSNNHGVRELNIIGSVSGIAVGVVEVVPTLGGSIEDERLNGT